MRRWLILIALAAAMVNVSHSAYAADADEEQLFKSPLGVVVPRVQDDPSVRYDYDIVYLRALRAGDKQHKRYYTDFSQPVTMEPGADLVLLHPDGSEELLAAGGDGSITDPVVSFDGQWVYFTRLYDLKGANQWSPPREGADIFKLHLGSRKLVKLTDQSFSPNTGAARWSSDYRKPEEGTTYYDYGVFNMGPCPLPGGRLAFTSNRDGFRPAKGYPAIALQLFVMDDSDDGLGRNIEKIGHLNISGALHPVALVDGRIMFSTLESQAIRSDILWGVWTIHPDGTNWAPLISAFDPGGAPNGFHFQTQLSDGSLVVEQYYNQNNSGFGAYIKLPPKAPDGQPGFGPGSPRHNKPWRFGRFDNGRGKWYHMPFMPVGSESLTPFALNGEGPADSAVLGDGTSPKVGKFTHPSGAPDNHMLTVYSHGPVNHQYTFLPQLDGGLYLLKDGRTVDEPAQLRLIKNDPNFNECWPRAVVPYRRIYGVDEPANLAALANDGRLSSHLPAGTPFGLVGTSSFYKRESYPNGAVPRGKTTAEYAGDNDPWHGLDPFTSHGNGMPINWHNQGGDAGLYDNSQIHAVRVLVMEPTTDRHRGANSGRRFFSHAQERLRIIGEIPLRKFASGQQPLDPDGNPDTSFLAKIPADTAFTFQTIDRDGMLLNMAQTWHQLRPGEVRHNCGGCHAHSQQPTPFESTVAARADYKLFDLTKSTPRLTAKALDKSGQKWDTDDATGLAITDGPLNVEYRRHIQPILARSCTACHSHKLDKPAGNLALDADDETVRVDPHGELPGTFARLAADERAKFGHKPAGYDSWGYPQASRYVRMFQSRRSLLVWKLFGKRLDGFSNDDHPSEMRPGSGELFHRGQRVDVEKFRHALDVDYLGGEMPPPDAVAGTYEAEGGRKVKVEPLSDEDRRTIVRWIDFGCPIDLDYDPARPDERGYGWMLDDNRPTLSVNVPRAGKNPAVTKIEIGMYDYYTGLDEASFNVVADFSLAGVAAGENLAPRFEKKAEGVWTLDLPKPLSALAKGVLSVSVRDRQGNETRIERTFSVAAE